MSFYYPQTDQKIKHQFFIFRQLTKYGWTGNEEPVPEGCIILFRVDDIGELLLQSFHSPGRDRSDLFDYPVTDVIVLVKKADQIFTAKNDEL